MLRELGAVLCVCKSHILCFSPLLSGSWSENRCFKGSLWCVNVTLLMFPHNVKWEGSKNLRAVIFVFDDRRSGEAEGNTPSTVVLQFVF